MDVEMAHFFLFRLPPDRSPSVSRVYRLAYWVEALIPRLLWAVASLLPTDAASGLVANLGRWIGPHLRNQDAILLNLRVALPDLGEPERAALLRDIWSEAGRILAEFALLDRICGPEAKDR